MHGVAADTLAPGVHTLGGRDFFVRLPTALIPAPVLICLHGNRGIGTALVDRAANGMPDVADSHILVGPDGPGRSWNVRGDAAGEDDVVYVGTTLIEHLASFDNVLPRFALLGQSQGAALTNRILIENDDPRITHAVTDSSQLNALQYHDSAFYLGGTDGAYTTVKAVLAPRNVLQMVGGEDPGIPANGGPSNLPGRLVYTHWEDSLLA